MSPESSPPPFKPGQFDNTKRPTALSDIGHQTKRLCTQPNTNSPRTADSALSYGYDSREESIIASDIDFDIAPIHRRIDPEGGWSSALPTSIYGGLDFNTATPTAGINPFIDNVIPSQICEIDMHDRLGEDGIYYQYGSQGSLNAFDLQGSFDMGQITSPNLDLSPDQNSNYSQTLLDSWSFPAMNSLLSSDSWTNGTLSQSDVTTEPQSSTGYQSLQVFTPSGRQNIEMICKVENTHLTQLQESGLVNNDDTSIGFSDVTSHNNGLSGSYGFPQPGPSEPISKIVVSFPNQIDVCFGVVIVDITSSWAGGQENVVPVTLSPFGDVVKLSSQDSKKYVGILALPALRKLQEEFTIEYTATMIRSGLRKDQGTAATKLKSFNSAYEFSVRIVSYGVKSEEKYVGQLLSDAGLYLQHPSASELSRHVEYWNPHYLLRPGSRMPDLENLSLSSDVVTATVAESMDETNKSRFMQVFNSANGSSNPVTLSPSSRLKSVLKDHQITALAMMIEKERGITEGAHFPCLWNISCGPESIVQYRHKVTGTSQSNPTPVYGGVLADEMGLGKTLSLLALVCSSLDSLADSESSANDGMSRATVIIAPKSTIPEWQRQIERHIRTGQIRLAVYHGSSRRHLPSGFWKTDIVLTTYETMRSDYPTGPLYSGPWCRVVLDEAHHIRNRSSQLFKAASKLASKSRWCLTGTPIHNSLDDYGALLSFLGVPLLMDKSQFDFWITNPIKQKRPNCLQTLGDLVRATCLRRTKDMTNHFLKLPQRIERIEDIELHQADQFLYNFFREKTAMIAAGLTARDRGTSGTNESRGANILTLINFLRRICDSGEDLLPESALKAWRDKDSTSVDWQMMRNCKKSCDLCGSTIEEADLLSDDSLGFNCGHTICTTCSVKSDSMSSDDVPQCPKCVATCTKSGNFFDLPKSSFQFSAKIEALIRNLDAEQTSGQYAENSLPVKSVIFSQWTKMLDLIAQALTHHGFRFQRIDGQSSLQQRQMAIQNFNKDPTCTVMVASIGSAGEGVDLTIANHVHMIEPHWSPMAEAQAVDRVHRIGQYRDVRVTRYIARDTIETYVRWIQQDKLRLITRSLESAEVLQSDIDEARWKRLQNVLAV